MGGSSCGPLKARGRGNDPTHLPDFSKAYIYTYLEGRYLVNARFKYLYIKVLLLLQSESYLILLLPMLI